MPTHYIGSVLQPYESKTAVINWSRLGKSNSGFTGNTSPKIGQKGPVSL